MRKCDKCRNKIPEGMKICPHCGMLPPRLFPKFFLYLFLTCAAIASAVCFRPFAANPNIAEQVASGTLWVAFVIFTVFALLFAFVSLVLLSSYSRRSYKGRLTKSEVSEFVRMKQHIESGNHNYGKGVYCTICGHRK